MGEVGGVVVLGLEVVEVMVARTTVQPQRHQAVGGPRQVVAAVVLHRQPDVDHKKGELGERVASQHDGVGGSEEAQTESLPDPRVFSGEGRGGGVGVVHLVGKKKNMRLEQKQEILSDMSITGEFSYLVEVAVEPRHFVVEQVPGEALEVKEQQANQHLS